MTRYKIATPTKTLNEFAQKLAFEKGYKWGPYEKELHPYAFAYGKRTYLFFNDCGYLSYGDDTIYDGKLITFDELINLKTKTQLNVDSLRYTIEETDKGYKIGCQEITKEDSLKIAEFFMENK